MERTDSLIIFADKLFDLLKVDGLDVLFIALLYDIVKLVGEKISVSVYLVGLHDDRLVARLQLLHGAELESEDSLVFCGYVHRLVAAYRDLDGLNAAEWDRAAIVDFLLVFTLAIFYESKSVIGNQESAIHRISILVIRTIATLSSHVITQLQLLKELETVLISDHSLLISANDT